MGHDDGPAAARRRRRVTVAGHTGDIAVARDGLLDADEKVRASALGSLERLGDLRDDELDVALRDESVIVRRRAVEVAATHSAVDLIGVLHDDDARVVEVAAWACGEHESDRDDIVIRLMTLGAHAQEALVRESAVAALGAIGDDRAIDVIIDATTDKPAVRRRAVLALAPFVDHPIEAARVDAAIERALEDRDWQVRQAAEDLHRIIS